MFSTYVKWFQEHFKVMKKNFYFSKFSLNFFQNYEIFLSQKIEAYFLNFVLRIQPCIMKLRYKISFLRINYRHRTCVKDTKYKYKD